MMSHQISEDSLCVILVLNVGSRGDALLWKDAGSNRTRGSSLENTQHVLLSFLKIFIVFTYQLVFHKFIIAQWSCYLNLFIDSFIIFQLVTTIAVSFDGNMFILQDCIKSASKITVFVYRRYGLLQRWFLPGSCEKCSSPPHLVGAVPRMEKAPINFHVKNTNFTAKINQFTAWFKTF